MDLLYHFIVGAAISISIVLIFGKRSKVTHLRSDKIIIIAALVPLLVGGGKELYDFWFGPGSPEVADVTMTWAGGLIGMFLILFIDIFRTDKY